MFAPAGKLLERRVHEREEEEEMEDDTGEGRGNGPGQKWVVRGRRGHGEVVEEGERGRRRVTLRSGREEDSFSSATPGQNRRSLESNY